LHRQMWGLELAFTPAVVVFVTGCDTLGFEFGVEDIRVTSHGGGGLLCSTASRETDGQPCSAGNGLAAIAAPQEWSHAAGMGGGSIQSGTKEPKQKKAKRQKYANW
jgi:hypothetical protein